MRTSMWYDKEESKSEVQLGFCGQKPMKTKVKYLKIYENSQILLLGFVQVKVTYKVILFCSDHTQRLYITYPSNA